MKARMALPIPEAFDIRRSHIMLYIDEETGEYVKTVHPASQSFGTDSLWHAYYRAADEQAKSLWRAKYGADMPEKLENDGAWAESTSANAFPHDGPTKLTPQEQSIVDRAEEFGDFTMDMLWLMVEGLGWRPGKPVPEDDLGWLVIWAEEETCGGSIDIIRAVLGMPEPPMPTYRGWKPPAVIAAYQQTKDLKA